MVIYRVIEENASGDYWRRSFVSQEAAKDFKMKCEEEEEDLKDQVEACRRCTRRDHQCDDFEDNGRNGCNNYYIYHDDCTFRIDVEEVND